MIQTFKCVDTQTLFERQSVKRFKAVDRVELRDAEAYDVEIVDYH